MKQMILGSCVTRDAFEFADHSAWDRSIYIARQSLASIGRPATIPEFDAHRFDSPFQNRLFHGDLAGNALTEIAGAVKKHGKQNLILVLDLIDERGGVYAGPGGQILTRSSDGEAVGLYAKIPDGWTLHAFGSLAHWNLYTDAAQRLKDGLEELGLWPNTRVLRVDWAETDTTDAPTEGSFGFTADTANEVLAGYYHTLATQGWHLVAPGITAIADPDHQWGAAPFHYTPEYYRAINHALDASIPRP